MWAVFKIHGFVCKRFLPSFPSIHRPVILCSRTVQKRLLRRLVFYFLNSYSKRRGLGTSVMQGKVSRSLLFQSFRDLFFLHGFNKSFDNQATWCGINYAGTQSYTTTDRLTKQRNSNQSSTTFLCFESPTVLLPSQHNLFRIM